MCEATAYLVSNGQQERIIQDVVLMRSEESHLLLATLLGERRMVKAKVKEIDFLKHTILLEEEGTSSD